MSASDSEEPKEAHYPCGHFWLLDLQIAFWWLLQFSFITQKFNKFTGLGTIKANSGNFILALFFFIPTAPEAEVRGCHPGTFLDNRKFFRLHELLFFHQG
jgi:hypothetical protein